MPVRGAVENPEEERDHQGDVVVEETGCRGTCSNVIVLDGLVAALATIINRAIVFDAGEAVEEQEGHGCHNDAESADVLVRTHFESESSDKSLRRLAKKSEKTRLVKVCNYSIPLFGNECPGQREEQEAAVVGTSEHWTLQGRERKSEGKGAALLRFN